jgi:hypothetical protein
MLKQQRIRLINELTIRLLNVDPVIASVILREHGWKRFGYLDQDIENNRYTITDFLVASNDFILSEINEYFMFEGLPDSEFVQEPETDEFTFSVFLSHQSKHKSLASDLKNNLLLQGIEGFVAHQDIKDNSLWRSSIKDRLNSSKAFVILLTDGIDSSVWCQQEVGWALAKEIPTIAVNFIEEPPSFGFLSDYQYIQYAQNGLIEIAERISNALLENPKTKSQFRLKKINLLINSYSYDRTRYLWKDISKFGGLNQEERDGILKALDTNPQVSDCSIDHQDPMTTIPEFLKGN